MTVEPIKRSLVKIATLVALAVVVLAVGEVYDVFHNTVPWWYLIAGATFGAIVIEALQLARDRARSRGHRRRR